MLLIFLLTVVVLGEYANAYECIVHVSELNDSNEDLITSGKDDNSVTCCVYGNCSRSSLDHALANLTSNVLINITTDVTLSSPINISDRIENVTIIGHNYPTVNCTNSGRIHLTYCHNCSIQGIIWDGCGVENIDNHTEPGIKVSNSSNISIKNCIFQYSRGQAVSLSDVSGDVNISHCNFVHNNHYRGHGAAIHYSSSKYHHLSLFKISFCNFTDNNHAKSLVYCDNEISEHNNNNITLYWTEFHHNHQAVSVYVVNQKIYLTGQNIFQNNTAEHVLVSNNPAIIYGENSEIILGENSNVEFLHNAIRIVFLNHSKFIFDQNCVATFNNNSADVVYYQVSSNTTFTGTCNVTFSYNYASPFVQPNVVLVSRENSFVNFKGYSSPVFSNNRRVIHSERDSYILFDENSSPVFSNNTTPSDGGVIFSQYNSHVFFKGNSSPQFYHNTAGNHGGAIYSADGSNISFKGCSAVVFQNNIAHYGGAVFARGHSDITFSNYGTESGGVGCFYANCNFVLNENAIVTFDSNKATHGGAVLLDVSNFIVAGNSTALFHDNFAAEGGGGIKALNSSSIILTNQITITFTSNTALYGGAIFLEANGTIFNNNTEQNYINFRENLARILGNSVYQEVSELCNSSCLNSRIIGISSQYITTPPNQLIFHNPAKCVNSNDTQCNSYYVQNIMLGAEIVIPACVVDYYNQSADSTQFLVKSENTGYIISRPKRIVIACNESEGITMIILRNKSLSSSTNISITITLNALFSEWKQISVNLIIELKPCHPGFWQYPNSMKCECYNADDIVLCSGSHSTIRRGYWFGSVTGKPTVSFCPINYCNFTCCAACDNYYYISPIRGNQCRSHRTGVACGSCTDDYTLSFDSTECVSTDSCTAGNTVLVILLTVIYWIVMVTLVFALMYYKVEIGYLYSITYYYSIVDILLRQNLQASRGLYLTVSIISSFSKITPQFLGELCLTTGMSGIDQQFIHYTHPLAVIIILVIITLLARRSRRISIFISRGIIHVICLLLLLSYTSIASTSLLLMRSLTFHDIDGVYSYLSPDIEYFHGRHLAYGILALICTITIVLGLPLILSLEPFLNHKINFTKIKPLLDQFQGCYKDKYRWFAGYYMICRLVIITIVIVNLTNAFANYLLVIVCGIMDIIHGQLRPYTKEILNKLDAIILHLIIFVAVLSILEDIYSPSVISTSFVLVILPLLIFISMTLFLHKDDLKKIIAQFKFKGKSANSNNDANNNEIPMREFDLIVDDSMRSNATICDINDPDKDNVDDTSVYACRESFLEVMEIDM